MQQKEPSEVVEPVGSDPYDPSKYPSSSSNKGGFMKLLGMIAPAALVLVFVLYQSGSYVTKTVFDSNVKTTATEIANIRSSMDALAAKVGSIGNDVNSVRTSLGNYATQERLNNSIAVVQNGITSAQGDIKTLQSTLSKYASTDDVKALSTKLDALSTQLTNAEATLKTVKEQAAATAATTANITASLVSGTTSTGTTTVASGQVGITLNTNPFTGSQSIVFSPIAANTTVAQSFSFNLINNTGKTLNNIQFAIGLELLDASNNVLVNGLPSGVSVTLTSASTLTVWTQQNTGISYILGFTNTVPSGIFGGIGAISQGTGTASYSVTVTMSTQNTPTQQINIIPLVKVIS